MKKSPVAIVKERFQSKQKLVDAVQKLATADLWVERLNAEKGLGKVSNTKLLKLHDTLSDAKQRFGSRDKLISAILELNKRTKDAGFSARLKSYALPQLLDLHGSVARAGKRAEAKAKGPVRRADKKAPAKKAVAKKAVAKKAVAKKSSKKKKK